MLVLNNELYEPDCVYKLGSKWLEFAYCGINKTPVARIFHKTKTMFKTSCFIGERAKTEKERFIRRIEHKKNNTKQGTFSNQNVFYGDFLKTRKKDSKGNPIYEQTRKNFNGQYEILNTIHTNYSTM